MEFWLKKDNSTKFCLSVKPSEYTVSVVSKNTVINVIQLGDINLIGKTGLREITLSSFFPAKDYNFSNNSDRKEPLTYVEIIEGWRRAGDIIRVIITGVLNMEVTIESFNYGEKDATGDIYYSILLREYRKIKTKKTNSSSATGDTSTRTTKEASSSSGKTYTVQSGDYLSKIAKQFYGDGSQWNKIYKANTDKISNPNVIHKGQVLTIP